MFVNKKISISISRKIIFFEAIALAVSFLAFYYFVANGLRDSAQAPAKTGAGTMLAVLAIYIFTLFAFYTISKKVLRKKIGEPLNTMADSTGEIVKGNYNIHFAIDGDNELGNLAKNLNFMSDVISQHTNLLEKKISAQGSELSQISEQCFKMTEKINDYENYPVFFNDCFSGEFYLAFDYLLQYSNQVKLKFEKMPDKNPGQDIFDFIKNLNYICSNGTELVSCIEEKALAMPVAGFKINKSELVMNDVLYHKVKFFNPLISLKNIKISNDIGKDAARIHADSLKFNYIFGRVLLIAIKYCHVNGKIIIRSAIEGNAAVFDVLALKKSDPSNNADFKKPLCDDLIDSGTAGAELTGITDDNFIPQEPDVIKMLGMAVLFVELHGGSLSFEIPDDKASNSIIKFHFKISQLC
ncbi:MAG: HAMP domain-containing protein [Candidatus Wallbacteria bacterium]